MWFNKRNKKVDNSEKVIVLRNKIREINVALTSLKNQKDDLQDSRLLGKADLSQELKFIDSKIEYLVGSRELLTKDLTKLTNMEIDLPYEETNEAGKGDK